MALPAHAAYLQTGGDARRTGVLDAGPEHPDVAFAVHVPGSRAGLAPPLVLDGAAYVLTVDAGFGEDLDRSAIWRVDLASAAVDPFVEFDLPGPHVSSALGASFASDGSRFFVVRDGSPTPVAEAYSVADGALLWTQSLPSRLGAARDAIACGEPAVGSGSVVVLCVELVLTDAERPEDEVPIDERLFVAAFDPETGSPTWTWWREATDEAARSLQDARSLDEACTALGPVCPPGGFVVAGGVSIVDSTVVASLADSHRSSRVVGGSVFGLALDDGTLRWAKSDAPATSTQQGDSAVGLRQPSLYATGDGGAVFVRSGADIVAYNPVRGVELWRRAIGRHDAVAGEGQAGLAFADGRLFAASAQTIYLTDAGGVEPVPLYTLPPESGWGNAPLLVDPRVVYARSVEPGAGGGVANTLVAIDAAQRRPLWNFTVEAGLVKTVVDLRYFDVGIGDGVAVLAGIDGSVTVLGRTPASIVVVTDHGTTYPAVAEETVVDLSRSVSGLHGPPTEYRADWGDGAVDDWQAGAVFRHAYRDAGDATARFTARNAAGQSATAVVTFHVGAEAPNALSRAFEPANQERTFFLLGLALTAAGGAFGLARSHRRRGLLQRELAAIDAAYARTKDRPTSCEAALAERRGRVGTLLADGRIDEAQAVVLERRVDDLARTLRTGEAADLLDHLPRRLARALEETLADGRVTALERDGVLRLVEQDRVLDEATKARLRALVDDWHARDHGRAR